MQDFHDCSVCTTSASPNVSPSVLKHATEFIGMCVNNNKNIGQKPSKNVAMEKLYSRCKFLGFNNMSSAVHSYNGNIKLKMIG